MAGNRSASPNPGLLLLLYITKFMVFGDFTPKIPPQNPPPGGGRRG